VLESVGLGAAAVAFGVIPQRPGSVDLLTQANVSITWTSSGKPKPKPKPYCHMRKYGVLRYSCAVFASSVRRTHEKDFPDDHLVS